ncbi:MAG: PQQ-binding-like beta-propeller repeat protein [Polyangia bacterium]
MLVSLRCSHCGAKLSVDSELERIRCEYCGTEFLPPRPRPKKRPETGSLAPGSARGSGASWLRGLLVLLPAVPALLIGWRSCGRSVRPALPGARFSPQSWAPRPLLRALWDDVGGPPVPVSLASGEAILGRMRLGADDQLYIVAADAKSAAIRWQIGPLGSYSEGYRDTWFAATAKHAVVTDFRGRVHVHALETGAELEVVPLTDRVSHLCPLPGSEEVALATIDGRTSALDTSRSPLSEGLRGAPLPAACGKRRLGHEPASPRRPHPSVPGLRVVSTYGEEDLAVASAVKSPGTPLPFAVGFDVKTRAVRWQTAIPAADALTVRECSPAALGGKRFFATCGVGSSAGWRLVALDADSGTRLWENELRPLFAVDSIKHLVATAQGVYVTRTSSLEILDPATGTLRGVLGNESYR